MITARITEDDYTFGRKRQEWEKTLPKTPIGKRTVQTFSVDLNDIFAFDPPVNVHPQYRIQQEGVVELRQRAPGDFLVVVQWIHGGFMDGGEITGRWASGTIDVDTATARRIAQFVWTPAVLEAAELGPKAVEQARERACRFLELDHGAILYQRERLLLVAGLDDASVNRRRASALRVAKLQNPDVTLLQHDALVAFDQTLLGVEDLASKMPPGAIKQE